MPYTRMWYTSDLDPHTMLDEVLCCCSLVDPALASHQHLDDCVLHFLDRKPSTDDFNDASSGSTSPNEDHGTTKRRKHREAMARLREGWRNSIVQLQREERHLQTELRRSLIGTPKSNEPAADPLAVLRQSYCTLVQEQLQLQQERADLESSHAHNAKYGRLLQRELERARLFRVTSDDDET